MYETETNSTTAPTETIPEEIRRSFRELQGRVQERTVLPWSEHCTECVWPTCYSTCDLYTARPDGGCRRFADGMVRVGVPEAVNNYVLKIRFKQWGKLWTPGNIRLHPAEKAQAIEKRDHRIGTALQKMPLPALVKITAATKRYGFKKRIATSSQPGEVSPTCFLLESYNPGISSVPLSLSMRALDERTRD